MNSDNVYMIDDDGQVVLMPVQNNDNVPIQQSFNNVNVSQINPVIVQTQPVTQPSVRQVSGNRMRNSIRYTQARQPQQQQQPQQPQYQQPQMQQPVYQRPQQPQPQQQQQQMQQPVYQRPQQPQQPQQQQPQQITHAPLLNNRVLNNQKQDESVSYNNWKKMNLSLTQMVSNNNMHMNSQVNQTEYNNNVTNMNEPVNEELDNMQPDFIKNSNRAKHGTFINNNAYSNRNYSTIQSKNIPSYLAIRKAHNSENIYL
jgi:hypothetical protein